MKNNLLKAATLLIFLIMLFNFSFYHNPEDVEPRIILTDSSLILIEYIPRHGNIFTSAKSWYDGKSTYYYLRNENFIKTKKEWRPKYALIEHFNYYGSEVVVETDTIYY